MAAAPVAIAATLAGLVAIAATVAIERLGGRVGGLLATVPTTIVPAAVFIWWAAPQGAAFEGAMGMVPAGMLLNAAFLWLWKVVPARVRLTHDGARLLLITLVNLGLWALGAFAMVLLAERIEALRLGLLTLCIGLGLGLAVTRTARPAPKGDRPVTLGTLLMRGLAAAAAIGLAVHLATLGSPLLAGIAAVFPAIFLTSMVALWISQGEAVPTGAVGPMMLGGMSVSVYALLATQLFPRLGPLVGSLVVWLLSVLIVTLPAGHWVTSRPLPSD